MRNPVWSILILSVPGRLGQLDALYKRLEGQMAESGISKESVEIVTIVDNRVMSIGEKRNLALSLSVGTYISFLDDDDDVSDDFVPVLHTAAKRRREGVICFDQDCTVNGKKFKVDFFLENQNMPAVLDPATGEYPAVITRKPYHMCLWNGVVARQTKFPDVSYGEDLAWLNQMWQRTRTQYKIPKVLHYYQFSDATSESLKRVAEHG